MVTKLLNSKHIILGQVKWTYLDDCGCQYSVGLYHGESSGHLLLYVNENPVIIDFSVWCNKKYTLFIGEELCDLVLEKKNNHFAYGLIPNIKADTNLNRRRRRKNKEDNIKTACMAVVLVLLIIMLNLVMISCH